MAKVVTKQLSKSQLTLIEQELNVVKAKISTLKDAQLIACVVLQVRIQITRSKMKQLVICMQFPADYPNDLLLVELKSPTLPVKFLEAGQRAIEANKENFIRAKQQILPVCRFVAEYLDGNPLCVCSDEVSELRKLINANEERGEYFKIRQKQHCVSFRLQSANYYLETKFEIPEDYPDASVVVSEIETDFPTLFQRYFAAKAKDVARRCVQPPLLKGRKGEKKPPPRAHDFKPKPSLLPVGEFLLENVRRYPTENCGLCDKRCFTDEPKGSIEDTEADLFIERVYCGHIFHHKCLDVYMSTPPFKGGKKCPKCTDGSVIYHDKWRASEQIREERWAHQQAKERELEEVEDFLS